MSDLEFSSVVWGRSLWLICPAWTTVGVKQHQHWLYERPLSLIRWVRVWLVCGMEGRWVEGWEPVWTDILLAQAELLPGLVEFPGDVSVHSHSFEGAERTLRAFGWERWKLGGKETVGVEEINGGKFPPKSGFWQDMTHRLSSSIKVVPSGLLSLGQIAPTFFARYFLARGLETARLHLLAFVTTTSWKKGRKGVGFLGKTTRSATTGWADFRRASQARSSVLSYCFGTELSWLVLIVHVSDTSFHPESCTKELS